jgi:hypothetical protein
VNALVSAPAIHDRNAAIAWSCRYNHARARKETQMHILRRVQTLAVAALLATGLLLAPTSPASAYDPDSFFVFNPWPEYPVSFTSGSIVWHNRTATIQGRVADLDTPGYTTAYFQAFAGTRQIGPTETRTINEGDRPFNFNIGDPDLRGGINEIRIWICGVPEPDVRRCSATEFYYR